MCCGHSRLTISNRRQAVSRPAAIGVASVVTVVRPNRPHAATKIEFEYGGATALAVVSPMTGNTYRFTRPGARVLVDPRDAPWLSFVPKLKRP